jgi:hypothetical protein
VCKREELREVCRELNNDKLHNLHSKRNVVRQYIEMGGTCSTNRLENDVKMDLSGIEWEGVGLDRAEGG